jgi:hypothetical protein
MAYWDCPRCAAENSLDATCCWRCGFQNYGAAQQSPPGCEEAAQSADVIRKERQDILEDVKKSVEDGLGRSRATLDRLSRGSREPGKT